MLGPVAKFGFLAAVLMPGLAAGGTGAEAQTNPNIAVQPGSDVSLKPRPVPKPVVDVNCLANPQSRACRSGPSAAHPRPRLQPNQPQGRPRSR